jgi:hypothetical protein
MNPITFTQKAGSEIAMLGKNEVGMVMPYPIGRKCKAIWKSSLGDTGKMPRGASDLRNAKRQLLLHIADWHREAGEPYAARAQEFIAQAADVLREAA